MFFGNGQAEIARRDRLDSEWPHEIIDFSHFSGIVAGDDKAAGLQFSRVHLLPHIGFRKKIIVFRRKPLASFFDKCISIFNKTPVNGAKDEKTRRPQRQPDMLTDVPKTKKERQGLGPPLKKNSQNAFAHQRKEIQMLRNHAPSNIGSVSLFVNGFVTLVSVALIAAAYFSAIGQFAA